MVKKNWMHAIVKKLFAQNNKNIINMSTKDAISIQQNYILESTNKAHNKICTPPFLTIEKELYSTKIEVVKASIYYLVEIANNEPQYKKQIQDILNNFKNRLSNSDIIAYIDTQMNKMS